jgi:hypothetical protein
MQEEYSVSPGFNVAEYGHLWTLHDRTIVHCFSKELLAYLKTLVAFCPYYRADDPRVTSHIDKYFHSALEKYQHTQYYELHGFLTELLTEWFDKYPPAAAGSKLRVRTLHLDSRHIRRRRSPTTLYVLTYDIVGQTYDSVFEHLARTGVGNDPAPPPNACQHGLSLSYALFITFMLLSQPEGMKHALVHLLTPRTAMATWEKDSPYVVYDILYDVVYDVIYNVAVGKKVMPAGEMCRFDCPNQKENMINSTFNL